jgi:MFS family permease
MLFAAGFHMVCTFTSANAHLQFHAPDEMRGRLLSIFSLSFLGLFPVGSFLSGTLAQHFGAEKVLFFGSLVGIGAVLWVLAQGFGRRF